MSKQESDSDTSVRQFRPTVTWANTISLGQMIQGGGVIVALVGLYYAMAGKIERAEMRLGSQQEIISRIERVTDSLAQSQHSIALTLATLTTKVEERRRTP